MPTKQDLALLRQQVQAMTQEIQTKGAAQAEQQYQQTMQEFRDQRPNSAEGMSTTQKVLAGIGSGMTNVARRGANMFGIDNIGDFDTSDEGIAQQAATDEDLGRTLPGKVGQFTGEMAALAPLGAVGGVGRVASALPKATGALLAAQAGGRVAQGTKALQAGMQGTRAGLAAAGVEGAAAGAVMSNPGERMQGAAMGAGLGAGLQGGFNVLRRTFGGLVKQSPAAQRSMQETGEEFMPISMAANTDDPVSNTVKWAYDQFLPYLPFTTKKLQSQIDDATNAIRAGVIRNAAPDGAPTQLGTGESAFRDLIGAVRGYFDDGYRKVFRDDAGDQLKFQARDLRLADDLDDDVRRIFTDAADGNGSRTYFTGDRLMEVKEKLYELATKHKGEAGRGKFDSIMRAVDEIDALVAARLRKGAGKANAERLANYQTLDKKFLEFKQVEEAVEAANKGGRFTGKDLSKAAARQRGPLDRSLRRTADDMQVLEATVPKPSMWGRMAALRGVVGPAVVTTVGGAPAALAVAAAGPALAARGTQQFLQGQTGAQKAIRGALATGQANTPAAVLRNALAAQGASQ